MATKRQRRFIGAAMITVGLFQAALGVLDDDLLFALLGLVYASIGVAYFWFEGYADGR